MAEYISERELRKRERDLRREQLQHEIEMMERQEEEERQRLSNLRAMRENIMLQRNRNREQGPELEIHDRNTIRQEDIATSRISRGQERISEDRHMRTPDEFVNTSTRGHERVSKDRIVQRGEELNTCRSTMRQGETSVDRSMMTPKELDVKRSTREKEKISEDRTLQRQEELDMNRNTMRQGDKTVDRGIKRQEEELYEDRNMERHVEIDADEYTLYGDEIEFERNNEIYRDRNHSKLDRVSKFDTDRKYAEMDRYSEFDKDRKHSEMDRTSKFDKDVKQSEMERSRQQSECIGDWKQNELYKDRYQSNTAIKTRLPTEVHHDESLRRTMNWIGDRYDKITMEKEKDFARRSSNINFDTDNEIERLKDSVERLQLEETKMLEEIDNKRQLQLKKESKLKIEVLQELREKEKLLKQSLMQKGDIIKQLENEEVKTEGNGGVRRNDVDKMSSHSTLSFKKPTIPKLTEDTFEEWKVEVEMTLTSGLYHEDIIRQEIRNSLTGKTRKILLNLDPNATTRELLTKLEHLYGNVRTGESIIAEFYLAKQKENENVTEWGIRLENIIQKAFRKGQVNKDQMDQMLRHRFWKQLFSSKLKLSTRIFFETCRTFEDLMVKVRIEENEMNVDSDSSSISEDKLKIDHSTNDSAKESQAMTELLERVKHLEKELEKCSEKSRYQERDTDRKREVSNNYRRENDNQRRGGDRNPSNNWNNRGRGRRGWYDRDRYYRRDDQYYQNTNYRSDRDERTHERNVDRSRDTEWRQSNSDNHSQRYERHYGNRNENTSSNNRRESEKERTGEKHDSRANSQKGGHLNQ